MLQRVRHGRPSLVSAAIHSVCWMMYGTPSVASSAKSGCVGGNCTSLIFLFCCVPWRLHRLFDIASSGLRPSFVIHFFKFFFFFCGFVCAGESDGGARATVVLVGVCRLCLQADAFTSMLFSSSFRLF